MTSKVARIITAVEVTGDTELIEEVDVEDLLHNGITLERAASLQLKEFKEEFLRDLYFRYEILES